MDGISRVNMNQTMPSNTAKAPAKMAETAQAAPQDTVQLSGGKKKSGVIRKFVQTVTGGVGLGSGIVGGGLIGAAVGSTGSLLTGLMGQGVVLASITAAGITGGVAGAAIFGIAGAYGGYKIGEMASKAVGWVKGKVTGK